MGRQDAAGNTAYYVPQIADERVVLQRESVEYYEIWHLKQADDFRNAGWTFIDSDYGENICKHCVRNANSGLIRPGSQRIMQGK